MSIDPRLALLDEVEHIVHQCIADCSERDDLLDELLALREEIQA